MNNHLIIYLLTSVDLEFLLKDVLGALLREITGVFLGTIWLGERNKKGIQGNRSEIMGCMKV